MSQEINITEENMKKFEYKVIALKDALWNVGAINAEKLERELNHLGNDGWEMITAPSSQSSGYTHDLVCIFKREKSN